jgi:hypothetical protein
MGLLRLLLEYPLSIIAFIVDFLYFKTKVDGGMIKDIFGKIVINEFGSSAADLSTLPLLH